MKLSQMPPVSALLRVLTSWRADRWIVLSLMCATVIFYGCFAAVGNDYPASHAFKLLGEGFLSGHTYLNTEPPPELAGLEDPYMPDQNEPYRTQDFSYYNGKYYLYFGPIPALTLWIPIKLITGMEVSDGALMLIFAMIGSCALTWLLYVMTREQRIFGGWELLIVVPAVVVGTWVPFVLREPFFYETAVCGAYAYSALGAVCLWYFLERGSLRRLAIGSLCFGLAVGCRINHVFNIALPCAALLYALYCQKDRRILPLILCASAPWLACMAGLALYNYERFGSFTEIGSHYMLTILGNLHDPDFKFMEADHVGNRLYFYLFHPLPLKQGFTFPFFSPSMYQVWRNNYLYLWSLEPTYGLLVNSPFSLLFFAFLFDYATRRHQPAHIQTFMAGMALSSLATFTFLLFYFFLSARYFVDFAPWVMVLAGVYYLQLMQRCQNASYYRLLLAAGILLSLYSVFTGSMAGYCSYTLCR